MTEPALAADRTAARQQLQTLQTALDQLRGPQSSGMTAQAFSQLARAQTALLRALPPRFDEVLDDLLNRLESSALFTEESCSFSASGLMDSLQLWLDKAQQKLA
jgi:hypothetical protein